MPTFSVSQLHEIGTQIFVAGGVQEAIAKQVVDSLVLSNLLGVDSHGLVRTRNYFDSIKLGAIVPNAEPKVLQDNGVAVLLDGCKAFGQIVAKHAANLAIEKARQHAIGAISFTDVYHIGRLGEYVTTVARAGMIGVMLANGSRPGGLVAPFGARQRIMGTNPIAFGIPAGTQPALVADFSTSAVAEGRVRIAMRKGQEVPSGWLVDSEGFPTTNPADLYQGGAIQSFGDYKGYALSILVEVLGGILSSADTPIFPEYKHMHNGVFLMAIQPTFFRPEQEYGAAVDYLFTAIRQALPAHGMAGALIPGEPEQRIKTIRSREGIPIDDATWAELIEVAAEFGVSLCVDGQSSHGEPAIAEEAPSD
jgi:LDH2 family malate/lactate/ureidoglycolate dehydrogenase